MGEVGGVKRREALGVLALCLISALVALVAVLAMEAARPNPADAPLWAVGVIA